MNTIKNISANWQYLNKEEFLILNEIFERHGTHTPLWVFIDTEGVIIPIDDIGLFAGQFYFNDKSEIVNVAFGLYNADMNFNECV